MMRMIPRFRRKVVLPGAAGAAIAGIAALALGGCTVYPEKKQPALAQTTSAEQVDRTFWQDVEQGKWTEANALLAPNAGWRGEGPGIPRGPGVPWVENPGVYGGGGGGGGVAP